jgi:hypothetical protein
MKKGIFIFLISVLFLSCEDQINPDLGPTSNQLVIDAFVNNIPGPQHIYINRSQPYFENEFPELVTGAEVFIEDLNTGERFDFTENDSAYTYVSPDSLGVIGHFYRLGVTVDGESFESFSDLGRVPQIDSINFTFEEAGGFVDQDFYLAEFVSRDPIGTGDTYWIKAWKNGIYLDKPSEINVAFDAGFTAGGNVDGQVFIQPIQNSINPFETDDNGDFIPPYLIGDSVYVEIHSINLAAFYFFQEVVIQTNRSGGFGALFAQPLANVPTNIINTNPDSDILPVGFFTMSAVSGLGATLTEERAAKAQEEADR